jgi:hypothetical protein
MICIGDRIRFSREAAANYLVSPDAIFLVEAINPNHTLMLRNEKTDNEKTDEEVIGFPNAEKFFIKVC